MEPFFSLSCCFMFKVPIIVTMNYHLEIWSIVTLQSNLRISPNYFFPSEPPNSTSSYPLDSLKNHPLWKLHNSPFIYLKQPPDFNLISNPKNLPNPSNSASNCVVLSNPFPPFQNTQFCTRNITKNIFTCSLACFLLYGH